MLLVNTTEFSISHCWLIEWGLVKRREEAACEIPKPCNQAALRARVLPTEGTRVPFPVTDPKGCDCSSPPVKALATDSLL